MAKIMIKEKVQAPVAVVLTVLALGLSAFAIFYTSSPNPQVKPASEIKMASASNTYYIDATNGNDNNNGLAETAPFKTLTRLYGVNIIPGDAILLKRGQVWQESLPLMISGSINLPITYGAYGTGDKPLIDGQSQLTNSAIGLNGLSHLIIKDLAVTNSYKPIVLYNTNNIVLDNISSYGNTGPSGIYLVADQSGKCENNTIKNSEVYNISGVSAAEVGDGILVYGPYCKNNLISANRVYNNANEGIAVWIGSNNIISQNTVNNNSKAGIRVANLVQSNSTASGNIVQYNTVYANAQNLDDRYGIDLWMVGNDNAIRYNKVYGQRDTYSDPAVPADPPNNGVKYGSGGIRLDGGYDHTSATGNRIYYNLISGEFTGIDVFNMDNSQIYNNDIYNSKSAGILVTSDKPDKLTSNTQIKNNIIYNVSASSNLIAVSNLAGSTINNNSYYQGGLEKFNWNMQSKNYSQWKSQMSQDANSIVTDPQFISPSNFDFSLSVSSPVIDHGVNVSLTQDYIGQKVPVGSAPDIGAYESQMTTTGPVCGNGVCETGEVCSACSSDCGSCLVCVESWSCSDWSVCANGSQTRDCVDNNNCGTTTTTSQACTVSSVCGNGSCEADETSIICCADCACSTGQTCSGGQCQTVACTPNCIGKSCGASDGCNSICKTGTCATNYTCNSGVCKKICNTRTCTGSYWLTRYRCTSDGRCCAGSRCKSF